MRFMTGGTAAFRGLFGMERFRCPEAFLDLRVTGEADVAFFTSDKSFHLGGVRRVTSRTLAGSDRRMDAFLF